MFSVCSIPEGFKIFDTYCFEFAGSFKNDLGGGLEVSLPKSPANILLSEETAGEAGCSLPVLLFCLVASYFYLFIKAV